MKDKSLMIKLPTEYTPAELKKAVQKQTGSDRPFRIVRKSLDSRRKKQIHWVLKIEFLDPDKSQQNLQDGIFTIPKMKNPKPVTIIGSGPAGIFSAILLAESGVPVTLLERGHCIEDRKKSIETFESGGVFDEKGNYAFGEGGAGAFSDGKLTSRSKHISKERAFVHQVFIQAGAPEEIAYLAHPHIGSDILYSVTRRLRLRFQEAGGTILFDTRASGFRHKGHTWLIDTSKGQLESYSVIAAPGHSARDTLKELVRIGVPFRSKPFALGMRAEHPQELINIAQWGQSKLPGVKAAEYRLTSSGGIYSFCMCPGGRIIPAAPFEDVNIVNGMSNYARDGQFANAAIVAAYNAEDDWGRDAEALEVLEWLTALEQRFKSNFGFQAPCQSIQGLIRGQSKDIKPDVSSFPLGLTSFDPWDYLPKSLLPRLRCGLENFNGKIKGFETGFLLGLESKTSSPVRAIREENGESPDFPGFFIAGEASGCAGGIISSAADGIKAALSILKDYQ